MGIPFREATQLSIALPNIVSWSTPKWLIMTSMCWGLLGCISCEYWECYGMLWAWIWGESNKALGTSWIVS